MALSKVWSCHRSFTLERVDIEATTPSTQAPLLPEDQGSLAVKTFFFERAVSSDVARCPPTLEQSIRPVRSKQVAESQFVSDLVWRLSVSGDDRVSLNLETPKLCHDRARNFSCRTL